jgi:hypothetical protein
LHDHAIAKHLDDEGRSARPSKENPMTDVSAQLAQRAAVDELIAATEKSASRWAQPSPPGKWSPSQVLEEACADFDRECLARAAKTDPLATATFGEVSIADYVRFMEIHTRHHLMQIPDA